MTSLTKKFARALTMSTIAAAIALAGTGTALAVPAQQPPTVDQPSGDEAPPAPTAEELEAFQSELEAAGIEPSVTQNSAELVKTYDSGQVKVVTVEPGPTPPGTVTPQVSVSAGWNIYIYFRPDEQDDLIRGGAATLIAAIGIANPAVAFVAAPAVTFALSHLSNNGICPGDLEISVNYGGFVNGAKCM